MLKYPALAIGLATGVLGGCLAAGPSSPPEPVAEDCHPEGHFAFLEPSTTVYRQGAAIGVRPMVDISPAGTAQLPPRCVGGWSVSGPARLSSDHSTLTIADEAPPGSEIVVAFRYREEPVVARLRVVAREAVVLTGTWSQKAIEGCGAREPVRELVLAPDGRFSVTYMPFETYKDYWGSYTFEAATGIIRMAVEDGNLVPAGLDLEGRAELSQGKLILRGLDLGGRQGAASGSCTYVF
jgi:hypothetical protein